MKSIRMFQSLSCVLVASLLTIQSQGVQADDILRKDVGTWNAKLTLWMPGQDEPVTAEGVETNRMMGDVWLVSDFKGEIFGQAFEGRASMKFDEKKKKYVGTWIDNMEPYMSMVEGEWDEEASSLNCMNTWTDPNSGETVKSRSVVKYNKDGSRVMTMYQTDESGKEVKAMMIEYTKAEKTDK